jgi:outer membrane protein TolC
LLVAACGCTSPFTRKPDLPPNVQGHASVEPPPAPATVQLASALEPAKDEPPFAGRAELSEDELVARVLARNPTVYQMAAAAEAAAARYPQVTSLEDPRAGGFFGPASIASRDVDFAYRVEVSQAFPFPGKRALRGEAAQHEAQAAAADAGEARLALAEAARAAFSDYFLATRSAEVNAEGQKLLGEFRENAASRYRNGQGEQQDLSQADVAIARQKERALALGRMQRVARARLNTLLHLPVDSPLPPPPKALDAGEPLPPAAVLRERAARERPDLAALRSRAAAEVAAVELAMKEYYPDFEVMAAYDTWWQRPERDLRPMVGLRFNLPVRGDRREAAIAEARARLAQRQAEVAKAVDQAGLQVQEAYEQLRETEQSLKLYEETALPAAREHVRQAQSSYTTGKVPFLSLIEAQRNLVELRDRQFELQTEARRRRAALERATGAALPVSEPLCGVMPPAALPSRGGEGNKTQ